MKTCLSFLLQTTINNGIVFVAFWSYWAVELTSHLFGVKLTVNDYCHEQKGFKFFVNLATRG